MAVKIPVCLYSGVPQLKELQPADTINISIFNNDSGYTANAGDLKADGSVPLSANWDVGAFTIQGTQFISDIAIGTAPFVVTSTTVVSNLNVSFLEGNAASAFAAAAHAHEGTAVLSTGEGGGTKFLREDGDNTCSWQAISGGGDALTSNPLSQFAATTSLQLKNTISNETGSGALVFAESPTLVTPALGTPASGVATNLTGTASGMTAGTVTGIGNLTGHITSTNRATLLGSFTLAQLNTAVSDATLVDFERRDIAFTDETSDLTTGDDKATFHMPNYATTLLEVSVGVTAAPTGTAAIFDLEENGTTVLSTLITIDAGEKTSEDAGTPPVISDSALAANALMTVNIDQIGSGVAGAGAKLYVKYKRA